MPWLHAELDVVKHRAVVGLGATAAQALLGPRVQVTRQRGQWASSPWAGRVMVTVHPSSILRAADAAARSRAFEAFVADLTLVRSELA